MKQQKFHKGDNVEVIRDLAGCEFTKRLIGLKGKVSGVRRDIDPNVDGTVNVIFFGHTDPICFYQDELLLL